MKEEGPVARAIATRRSVRRFRAVRVDPAIVRRLVELACAAPAPHHSRPWRFVHVRSQPARKRLADVMSQAWLSDALQDETPAQGIEKGVRRSREQVLEAPVLLLACLSLENARRWPDERRRGAERDMFVQSLGAALQNLLLSAAEYGLAGYLKGAPLFCRDEVRSALELPADWDPCFLALLGYPEEGFAPPPREPLPMQELFVER